MKGIYLKDEIMETPDYTLSVSDGDIKIGDLFLHKTNRDCSIHLCIDRPAKQNVIGDDNVDYFLGNCKKIIAYQPKNNAPELDLPLLPDMVVEDDVERLACNIYNLSYEEYLYIREHISQTRESIESEYEHLGLEIPNKYFYVISFIEGHNYKAATKKFSEEDLRKAIRLTRGSDTPMEEIIESLKQAKPKWFVAEVGQIIGCKDPMVCLRGCNIVDGSCRQPIIDKYQLKTTTIDGKEYLVGKYSNE